MGLGLTADHPKPTNRDAHKKHPLLHLENVLCLSQSLCNAAPRDTTSSSRNRWQSWCDARKPGWRRWCEDSVNLSFLCRNSNLRDISLWDRIHNQRWATYGAVADVAQCEKPGSGRRLKLRRWFPLSCHLRWPWRIDARPLPSFTTQQQKRACNSGS